MNLTENNLVKKDLIDLDPSHQEIFNLIKNNLEKYFSDEGFNYIPDNFEFRASSIPYCQRKILLEKNYKNYLTQDEIKLLPIWYLNEMKAKEKGESIFSYGPHIPGTIIHQKIQQILDSKMLSYEEEVKVKIGNATIIGHYDMLLETKAGEKIVIDIKTTNSTIEFLPKSPHLIQLLTYQGILGGIKGALLYVNRNSFELNYIPQEFDKDRYSKILVKVSELARCENNKELPPAIPEYDYECSNESYQCQFYDVCFKNNQ